MSKRRPVYLKAVDVLALLLVSTIAVGFTARVFARDPHGLLSLVVDLLLAVAADLWFLSLVLEVRYLWTGKHTRVRDLLRRRARRASP